MMLWLDSDNLDSQQRELWMHVQKASHEQNKRPKSPYLPARAFGKYIYLLFTRMPFVFFSTQLEQRKHCIAGAAYTAADLPLPPPPRPPSSPVNQIMYL